MASGVALEARGFGRLAGLYLTDMIHHFPANHRCITLLIPESDPHGWVNCLPGVETPSPGPLSRKLCRLQVTARRLVA